MVYGGHQDAQNLLTIIGVGLRALNTLKTEKITPTEENIADGIRNRDPRHRNTDVKKAITSAIEQQMVVQQKLGTLQLYPRREAEPRTAKRPWFKFECQPINIPTNRP